MADVKVFKQLNELQAIWKLDFEKRNKVRKSSRLREKNEKLSIKSLLTKETRDKVGDRIQSVCIRIGNELERLFVENIKAHASVWERIVKLPGCKHQLDVAFISHDAKTIFYAELKANLNLDTEKLPATLEKVTSVRNQLLEAYPEYTCTAKLVSLRFATEEDVRKNHRKVFEDMNMYGYQDLLKVFFDVTFTEADWAGLINDMALIIDNSN